MDFTGLSVLAPFLCAVVLVFGCGEQWLISL
jgi:hypothetical protein